MGFTTDESLLNGINLDTITEYQDFLKQIQPILLGESGYQSIDYNLSDEERLGKLARQPRERVQLLDRVLPGYQSELARIKQSEEANPDQKGIKHNIFIPELEAAGIKGSDVKTVAGLEAEIKRLQDERVNLFSTSPVTGKRLEKTPERKALEERLKKLQNLELKQVEEEANYLESPEYKETIKKQQEIQRQLQDLALTQAKQQASSAAERAEVEKRQRELTLARAERQRKALAGEIPLSDGLKRELQEQFNALKETEARRGNAILGEDPFTATAKGTAANEALKRFQSVAQTMRQNELNRIIEGEGPLFSNDVQLSSGLGMSSPYLNQTPQQFVQGSLPMIGQLTQGTTAFQRPLPQNAGFEALSGLSLSAQQPFQFNREMEFRQQQADMERRNAARNRRSGRLGAIGSLAGGGAGLALSAGNPMMGMFGSQLGGGMGQLFGGM